MYHSRIFLYGAVNLYKTFSYIAAFVKIVQLSTTFFTHHAQIFSYLQNILIAKFLAVAQPTFPPPPSHHPKHTPTHLQQILIYMCDIKRTKLFAGLRVLSLHVLIHNYKLVHCIIDGKSRTFPNLQLYSI